MPSTHPPHPTTLGTALFSGRSGTQAPARLDNEPGLFSFADTSRGWVR